MALKMLKIEEVLPPALLLFTVHMLLVSANGPTLFVLMHFDLYEHECRPTQD